MVILDGKLCFNNCFNTCVHVDALKCEYQEIFVGFYNVLFGSINEFTVASIN
jgi:hypothetical protein